MEEEEAAAGGSRLVAPCGAPGCTSPEKPTRLALIPADFAGARRDGSTCYHSKRANCKRHFQGGEKGVPGRPRAQQVEVTQVPQGKAVNADPMPPIINSVDEVWGFRYALAPILLAFCACL